MVSDYFDIRYGSKTPLFQQFSVEQAIDAAKWDKHSTWQEIIRQSDDNGNVLPYAGR